jgi:hypothetical protein
VSSEIFLGGQTNVSASASTSASSLDATSRACCANVVGSFDAPDADAPIDDEPAALRFLFLSIFRSSKAIAHDAK